MTPTRTPLVLATALLLSPAARAQILLSENFDNVAGLAGSGWVFVNNSEPVGPVQWQQGVVIGLTDGAHSGASNSYAESNVDAVADEGTISDWMITPAITVANGDSIVFWTLSAANSTYADRLEVRISPNGGSDPGPDESSVGDFTTLVLVINPSLNNNAYPSISAGQTWTRFGAAVTGLGTPASCRVAFRYWVTDGGFLGNNSSAIGIDDLEVFHNSGVGLGEHEMPVLQIGPGPGADQFLVTMNGPAMLWDLRLTNAAGQLVMATTINGSRTIDLSGYASGVYVFAVQDPRTGRLLRERMVKR